MGYSTAPTSMLSPDMRQTPENVRKVLDIAGWTQKEAIDAMEGEMPISDLVYAMRGTRLMPDDQWKKLLDVAGKRSFDHDGESA
ncbi:hypothetical protein [Nitrosovibrio sp. Nv6]|uniref:hypothetical protein n=1 Tax=Nitrosovibrio sp. Nv6 TaxID=1855340 RepID=UPI0008AB4E23|nr:hypothetical protein [Nitrosovibrio sp. Nv6]SEO78498.1 hypothetical protein SAMN05216316_1092 [Nitrosovibrio sp. Nv6]